MVHFYEISFTDDPVRSCAVTAQGCEGSPLLFVGSSDDEVDAFLSAVGEELQFIRPTEGSTVDGIECPSKKSHLTHLLCNGKNVAMKSSLLNYCGDALQKAIRCNGYILISPEDAIIWADKIKKYNSANMEEAIRRKQLLMVAHDTWLLSPAHKEAYVLNMLGIPAHTYNGRLLLRLSAKDRSTMYWGLQPQLFESFAEAYIFHPMMQASQVSHYMQAVGVRHKWDTTGPHSYDELRPLLHIVNDTRYNQKGEDSKAYTTHWYAKKEENTAGVYKDMLNVLLHTGAGRERREDIAYVMPEDVLDQLDEAKIRSVFRGRGFAPAQQYSGNSCSTTSVLCYCANTYLPSSSINYLHKNGADLTQDAYALYRMLRWIGRTAIRDRKPVTVYVPSKRMRTLLVSWLNQQDPNYWMYEDDYEKDQL